MRFLRFATCLGLAVLVSGCAGFATKQESQELRKKTAELRQDLTESNNRLDELATKFSLLQEKLEEQKMFLEKLSSSAPAVPEGLKVVALGGIGSKDNAQNDLSAEGGLKKSHKQGPPAKADVALDARQDAAPQTRISSKSEAIKAEATKPEAGKPEQVKSEDAKGEAQVPEKDGQVDQTAMYDRGRDLFMAGKIDAARNVFAEFVKRFPSSSLADNAVYWIGESYYSERDFPRALEKFRELVSRYPNENKAPDAMLKAGLALMEMKEPERAKEEFDALVKRYPDSEAAIKAKKILATDAGKARKK